MASKKEEELGGQTAENLFSFETHPVLEDRVTGPQRVGSEPTDSQKVLAELFESDKGDIVKMVKSKMGGEFFGSLAEVSNDDALDEALAQSLAEFRQGLYIRKLSTQQMAEIIEAASKGHSKKASSRQVLASLSETLDTIASRLEEAGRKDLAMMIDAASNSIDSYRGTK